MNVQDVIAQYEVLEIVVHSASQAVVFDAKEPRQLCSVSLHGTLLELSHGATQLLKSGDATCTPILLRAMLEAYVDLSNLVDDPGYLSNMGAAWIRQRLRIAKAARDRGSGNPYLTSIVGDEDLSSAIIEMEAQLSSLRHDGRSELTVRERFERAREGKRYDSVYAHLCSKGHNNLGALEERHIEHTSDGYQVVYFRGIEPSEIQMYVDTMAGIIANSIAFVKQIVEPGEPRGLDPVGEELQKLRSLYREE